jgi:hypothetical protein
MSPATIFHEMGINYLVAMGKDYYLTALGR